MSQQIIPATEEDLFGRRVGGLGNPEQSHGAPCRVSPAATSSLKYRLTAPLNSIAHPIHLHCHDFWVLAQASGSWDGTTDSFQTINSPRRDTAVLPAQGHLAIAFRLDNPGTWILHCHIVWHASQGLSLEFVESEESISIQSRDREIFQDTCRSWDEWAQNATYPHDGSEI